MQLVTVVDGEDYKLEVYLSRSCSPGTLEGIQEYLVKNKHTEMFEYAGYWKYEFKVQSKPITINDETFVIRGRVGGSSDYIYRFSPEDTTLDNEFNQVSSQFPSTVDIDFL